MNMWNRSSIGEMQRFSEADQLRDDLSKAVGLLNTIIYLLWAVLALIVSLFLMSIWLFGKGPV